MQVPTLFLQCLVTSTLFSAPCPAPVENPPRLPVSPAVRTLEIPQSVLQAEGRRITVQIVGAESTGSGVLIHRNRDRYLVITNQHVLRSSPYKVRTPDGQFYDATVLTNPAFQGHDLAIVEFRSSQSYEIARLGNPNALNPGDKVFAAGFPFLKDHADEQGFRFTAGRVALILPKALQDGYQLGYTSIVEKGMSGGAVLNRHGELVGINGMGSHPLWDERYFYADGSQPCQPIQERIREVSWGIPTDTIAQLSSSITPLSIASMPRSTSTMTSESSEVLQLKEQAIATSICQS